MDGAGLGSKEGEGGHRGVGTCRAGAPPPPPPDPPPQPTPIGFANGRGGACHTAWMGCGSTHSKCLLASPKLNVGRAKDHPGMFKMFRLKRKNPF